MLQSKHFKIQTPFELHLKHGQGVLVCTDVLRHVPGKRVVCKAKLGTQDVIAKFFIQPFHADRHIKREAKGLKLLDNAKLPVPKIIYQASAGNGIKLLITEYLHDTISPSVYFGSTADPSDQDMILRKLLSLLAMFHRAGLMQQDLHLNNFLLQNETLYAIDAANMESKSAPLSSGDAFDNLKKFLSQFDEGLYPIIASAMSAYQDSNPDVAIDTTKLLKEAHLERLKLRKNIAKKVFRNTTDIICKDSFTRRIICKRRYYKGDFLKLLDNTDKFIKESRLLKDGGAQTVALVEVDGEKFVIKRYNIKNPFKLLRRQWPPSRVEKNWYYSHLLKFHKIATPEPIAVIEKRFGPLRFEGYLVMQYVDARNVKESLWQAKDNPEAQKEILLRFTKTLKKLADHKISHGDFKMNNFLDTPQGISIIDLDALQCHSCDFLFKQAQKKDFDRFFRNFAGDAQMKAAAKKMLDDVMSS